MNMENVDVVGVWKVVGCVALCKNSDLTICNGASLILRPDGSLSWFGPAAQGILDFNNFCAYKFVRVASKNALPVNQATVGHPSISLVFESSQDSTYNPHVCCEVTMKFGNAMVIQFPGLCLIHLRRLSKDFENRNSEGGCADSVGVECNASSSSEQNIGKLVESNAGHCSESRNDIRHTDHFSLNVLKADSPGSYSAMASANIKVGNGDFHSTLDCDSHWASTDISSSSVTTPFQCNSFGSTSLPEVNSLPLSSSASSVNIIPNTLNGSLNPETFATSPSEHEHGSTMHNGESKNFPGSLHFLPSQTFSASSSLIPSNLPSNTSYISLQSSPVYKPTSECSPSHSFDSHDGIVTKEYKGQNLTYFMDESNNPVKDSDKLKTETLEEPTSPSTSSLASSSSVAQLSSHKCQDQSFSLLRALEEGYFSDLVLVAENGVKFEVHSTILALSFPNIIWEHGSEDNNQRKTFENLEIKSNTYKPSVVTDIFIEPTSNVCKNQENRHFAAESQKIKLKTCSVNNCCHAGQNYSKSDELEEVLQTVNIKSGNEMEDWTRKSPDIKAVITKASSKPASKRKEDSPKVKLPCLPEAVLRALLHYAYSESLPPSLASETAQLCIKLLSPPSPVASHTAAFLNLCSAYLRNTALRQDIVSLTSEIHGCLSKMEEHLGMGDYQAMASSEEEEEEDDVTRRRERRAPGMPRDKGLLHPTPGRLCTALKQAAREAAVAVVLALELCQVYAKNRCHLEKMEIHEVAQYAASRLAPLASQLDAVLSAILRSIPPASSSVVTVAPHSPPLHSNRHHNGREHRHQLPHGEGTTLRDRLASHLVPEMESALEVLSNLAMCLKEDLEEVLRAIQEKRTEKDETESAKMSNEDLGTTFQQVDKESRTEMLSMIHQKVSFYLFHLLQKKESFSDLGNGGRFRVICQTLEQLSEELPIFLLRLRDALATIDEQLVPEHLSLPLAEWTSKINGLLTLLSAHQTIIQPLLLTVSELVQREAFLLSLRRLKLVNSVAEQDEATCSHISSSIYPIEGDSVYKLSLVRSLVTPPNSRCSHLSRRALRLMQTSRNADMVFQVALPTNCDADNPPIIDNRLGSLEWDEDGRRWVWRVGAHRAIVAARCDWFRRALLSGMKEAIKRKIVVHDTTPQLLQLFLQWIYGGQLQFELNVCQEVDLMQEGRKGGGEHPNGAVSAEQLWALLVLADQLEVDDLKSACEHLLLSVGCHLADPEATLACLSLADQVNARAMRSACLQHISCNPSDVVESELFEELPSNLQSEVYDRLIWSKPRKSQTTEWLLSTPEEDEDDTEEERKFGDNISCPLYDHSSSREDSVEIDHQQHNLNGHAMRDEVYSGRSGPLEDSTYSET